jgi:hypothetical protein
MPSSNPESISVVLNVAYSLAPRAVLDVGAGNGKYGVLLREYLELRHADRNAVPNTAFVNSRNARIDAVEGYEPYVGELHRLVYDNVFIENIAAFVKRECAYDLIVMGDVLEHLDKDVAFAVLPVFVERATMGVLIIVPSRFNEQSATYGNELEIHRSFWRPPELRQFSKYSHVGRRGAHLYAFLTNNRGCYNTVRGSRLRRKVGNIKRALLESW